MLWNLATVWWDLSSQHTLATLQHVCSLVTEADRSLKFEVGSTSYLPKYWIVENGLRIQQSIRIRLVDATWPSVSARM
jgi:hypothetical protein